MPSRYPAAVAVAALGAGFTVVVVGCYVSTRTDVMRYPTNLASGLVVSVAVGALAVGAWRHGRRVSAHAAEISDQRMDALMEVGEEVMWECDTGGRLIYASPQCLELLGHHPAEARSLSLLQVLHPDEHAAVQNLLASGQGWRRRLFRCLAKDGTIVWLRSTAVARADRRGRLVGLVGASHRASALPADTEALAAVAATVRQVIDTGGVRPVFQPIVSLSDGHLVGVEALSRFHVPGDARSPQDWFTDAARVGLGIDLEVHAVELALRAATALPEYVYVSVNLSPDALLWPGLATVLARSPLPLTRVVVELTEHEAVQDYDELARALQPLRLSGIRLAVDDAGAGYACFRHILALSPEVIKLDRSLISGIDTDSAQRALAAAIVGFAGDVHATVVAEGIERPAELAAALELSVGCGQGNLLGLPSAIPADSLAWDPAGELLPTANAIAIARHS